MWFWLRFWLRRHLHIGHIHHIVIVDVNLRLNLHWHLRFIWFNRLFLLNRFRHFLLRLFLYGSLFWHFFLHFWHWHRFLFGNRHFLFATHIDFCLRRSTCDRSFFLYCSSSGWNFYFHTGHNHIRVAELRVHLFQLFKVHAVLLGDLPKSIPFLYDMDFHSDSLLWHKSIYSMLVWANC